MNAKEIIEITKDNQIEALNKRIHELECQIQRECKPDTRQYNPNIPHLGLSVGLTQAQADELDDILSFWLHKHGDNGAIILQKIEEAPVSYREKSYMCVCLGINHGIMWEQNRKRGE